METQNYQKMWKTIRQMRDFVVHPIINKYQLLFIFGMKLIFG